MAAKRFRGANSPDAKSDDVVVMADAPRNPLAGKTIKVSNFRANLLFFVPLPLLLNGFSKMADAAPLSMLASFGAFGLLILSAWLLREGLKAEAAYNIRKVARPPMPRKIIAADLSGIGVGMAAWLSWGQPLWSAAIFGVFTAVAFLAAFGLDPLRKKGMEGFNEFETNRVAKAVEKAEKIILQITDAAARIGDHRIETQVNDLTIAAGEMLRVVEDDPRDLTSARKFMTVYLMGARDATVKFSDVYSRSQNQDARTEYETLLKDLQSSFEGKKQALLQDDNTDLDVEIEVLRERLQREGHLPRNEGE